MMNFAMEMQMPDGSFYLQILMLVAIFALFYFMLIRPQKKREKADKEMRETIVAGDRICTIGGIVGKVVQVSDDTIVIETSGNRMKFYKWAIRSKIEKEAVAEEK